MKKVFYLINVRLFTTIKKSLIFTLLISCSHLLIAQNCECNEFMYLNDTQGDAVHKFQVGSNGSLTEIFNSGGGIWYPGPAASELQIPTELQWICQETYI